MQSTPIIQVTPTTEVNSDAVLSAMESAPRNSPIFMVNLLRYRERTDDAPCSGREAYFGRYIAAFNQAAASEGVQGIKILYAGAILAHLVAPSNEAWNDVAIVEYPSFEAFQRVTQSPHYTLNAAHHRRAALEDWRLLATAKVAL